MLACALAPALPARETTTKAASDCCCHDGCGHACGERDCAPPPAPPVRAPAAPTLAVLEQRVAAAKPAAHARMFAALIFSFEKIARAPSARFTAAPRMLHADGVALFQAHCSFLI